MGGEFCRKQKVLEKVGLLVPALTLEELPVLSVQTKQAGPLMGAAQGRVGDASEVRGKGRRRREELGGGAGWG